MRNPWNHFQNQGEKLQPPDKVWWDYFFRVGFWEAKKKHFFWKFWPTKTCFWKFWSCKVHAKSRRGNMVSKNFDRYVIVCHGMPGKGATVPVVVEVWSLKKSHGDEISTATKCQCTRNLPHCRPSNACSSKLLQWFWNWETQLDNSLGEANYKKRRTSTEWKPQLFSVWSPPLQASDILGPA